MNESLDKTLFSNELPFQGTIVEVNEDIEKRLQVADDFSSSDSSDECDNDDDDDDRENASQHDDDNDCHAELDDDQANASNPSNKINLDVSTLICLVSELTHGGHIYQYPNKWLEVPAEMERASRLAPKLENYMRGKSNIFSSMISYGFHLIGKELLVCQTAFDEFQSIVNTVGGPNERQRAEELFKRVIV